MIDKYQVGAALFYTTLQCCFLISAINTNYRNGNLYKDKIAYYDYKTNKIIHNNIDYLISRLFRLIFSIATILHLDRNMISVAEKLCNRLIYGYCCN